MEVVLVHNALIPVAGYGGTERVMWWLAKALGEKGHSVTIVARFGSRCPFAKVVEMDFANLTEAMLPPGDVLHYFFPPKEEPRRPHVITIHGNGKPGEAYFPNSNFLSKDHAFRHGSDCYVYNGVDPGDYFFSERKGDYLLFLAKASWRVKNVDGAIRIARRARRMIRIVGGRRWWANPWGWARWEGEVGGEAKARLAASAVGLLFPVLWPEPFGLAVVEAMVSGTPVLGSAFGSLPELLGHAGGKICHSEDDFAKEVGELGKFRPHEVREWALSKFHYHEMAKGYLALYERIAAGGALNPSPPRARSEAQRYRIPRRT